MHSLFFFAVLAFQAGSPEWAARFEGGSVSMRELDRYVAWKHGKREEGVEARQHLRQRTLVDREAARRGLVIAEDAVSLKMAEVEQALGKTAFEKELRDKQLSRSEFAALLRISLAHEKMVREDLGLRAGEAIGNEQIQLWIADREKKAPEPFEPSAEELGRTIRSLLGHKGTKSALFDLVGSQLVEKRAREAGIEIGAKEIEEEIARRRERIAADERYQGVSFEELLKTQGISVEDLRQSPGLRASILLERLARSIWPPERLHAAYEQGKAEYDGRFGESRKVYWILIRGGESAQTNGQRSSEDAWREAESMRGRIASLADFQRLAKIYSEDDKTKTQGGEIGFLRRHEPQVEDALLQTVAQARPDSLAGCVKLRAGTAVLWVGEIKPAPPLETILEKILEEKRGAYYTEMMQAAKVITFLE